MNLFMSAIRIKYMWPFIVHGACYGCMYLVLTTLSHKLQKLWSAVTFSISLYGHKGDPIHSHIQDTKFNFIGATLHRKQTIDSYNGFKFSVKIAGGLSNWLCPQQRVHQGDVYVPFLHIQQ